MAVTQFIGWLEDHLPSKFRVDEPMQRHTSFRIGGPADVLVLPETAVELITVIKEVRNRQIPLTILGNGSNVLVKDQGIRGVVVKIGNVLRKMECLGEVVQAEAGVSLAAVSNYAAKNQLTGLEFAVGIPGSLGGAVFMNAGAYDGEMKNVVKTITVLTQAGEIKELTCDDLHFGYRHSCVQDDGSVIIAVTMELKQGSQDDINAKMADFTNRRVTKQPLELPNAGSMFKRPEGYFAGTLIEEAGLKGYTVGGAQVSRKHAGFIVNVGDATAQDVLQLIKNVQDKVYDYAGVKLEPEVRVFGE